MLEALKGKKTYIVGIAMIVAAAANALFGDASVDATVEAILVALGMMGLRNGMN